MAFHHVVIATSNLEAAVQLVTERPMGDCHIKRVLRCPLTPWARFCPPTGHG
jgi:catechol 2,3-dioxygenase-like lactoylglutathione lyase family enzyme